MFADNCTSNIQFYNLPNDYYQRAAMWSIWLSHVYLALKIVFAIQAVNEPMPNAGLFDVRFSNLLLGIYPRNLVLPNLSTSFPVAPTAGTRRDSQEVIRLASLPFLQLSQTPSPCASLGPVPITTRAS